MRHSERKTDSRICACTPSEGSHAGTQRGRGATDRRPTAPPAAPPQDTPRPLRSALATAGPRTSPLGPPSRTNSPQRSRPGPGAPRKLRQAPPGLTRSPRPAREEPLRCAPCRPPDPAAAPRGFPGPRRRSPTAGSAGSPRSPARC